MSVLASEGQAGHERKKETYEVALIIPSKDSATLSSGATRLIRDRSLNQSELEMIRALAPGLFRSFEPRLAPAMPLVPHLQRLAAAAPDEECFHGVDALAEEIPEAQRAVAFHTAHNAR